MASNAENVSIWWRHHIHWIGSAWPISIPPYPFLYYVAVRVPFHDDVIKWKHFRVTGHLCGEFTGHKGQWRGALICSLICPWINGWVNNGEANDLRRHRAHCDVTVMILWDWQHQAMSNTGSPCISVLRVYGSQATSTDTSLHTFRRCLFKPSCSVGIGWSVTDLIQVVALCTCPYHLSCRRRRTTVIASMPSFCSS